LLISVVLVSFQQFQNIFLSAYHYEFEISDEEAKFYLDESIELNNIINEL